MSPSKEAKGALCSNSVEAAFHQLLFLAVPGAPTVPCVTVAPLSCPSLPAAKSTTKSSRSYMASSTPTALAVYAFTGACARHSGPKQMRGLHELGASLQLRCRSGKGFGPWTILTH